MSGQDHVIEQLSDKNDQRAGPLSKPDLSFDNRDNTDQKMLYSVKANPGGESFVPDATIKSVKVDFGLNESATSKEEDEAHYA